MLTNTMALLACGLLICNEAQALEWQWRPGGAMTWTSDYVFRGVSQSNNQPVVQADLHIQPLPQWTLGLWASGVHLLPDSSSTEYNVYLDGRWSLDQDLAFGVTAVHYDYLDDPRPISYRYDELSLSVTWHDQLYLSASWSPNALLTAYPFDTYAHQQTLTVAVSHAQALPWQLNLQLGVGYYVPLEQNTGDYWFGNAGLSRQWRDLRLELAYFCTQAAERRRFSHGDAGGPWAATVTWRF